jgi:uncharacterized protein (DUF1330 family)
LSPRFRWNPETGFTVGQKCMAVMLIESDNMEAARTFYESDEYTAAKFMREMAAMTDLLMIEGL